MTWETDLNQSIADAEAAIAQAPTPNCGTGDIPNDAYNATIAGFNASIAELRSAFDAGIPPMCIPAPISDPDLFSRYSYSVGSQHTIGSGFSYQDLSGMCNTQWGNVLTINESGVIHELTPSCSLVKSISLMNWPFDIFNIEAIVHIAGTNEYWILDETSHPLDGSAVYKSKVIKVTIDPATTSVDCSVNAPVAIGGKGYETGWFDPADSVARFMHRKPGDAPLSSVLANNSVILNDPFDPDVPSGASKLYDAPDAALNNNLTPNPVLIQQTFLREIDKATGNKVNQISLADLGITGKVEGLTLLDNADIILSIESATNHIVKLTATPV